MPNRPKIKNEKRRVVIIGPYPPPIGGVAMFVKNQLEQRDIFSQFDLDVYRTGATDFHTSYITQIINELVRIVFFCCKFKNNKTIDIFHVHTASYWSFIRNIPYILFCAYFTHGKVIVHIHGAEFHIFNSKSNLFIKGLIRFCLKSSDAIVVTAPSWIDKLKSIWEDDKYPIYVIPNGYDQKKFCVISKDVAREKLNLPKDQKIFLSIGHLEKYKGHEYLINAIKNIVSYRYDVLFIIIGSGSLNKYLDNLINENNLSIYIKLVGNQNLNDLILWLNSSDFFILPSLNEGNPTVMFEALGLGLPFLGTKVGGIPDIINSDDYGLLCDPGNSKELEKIILLAINRNWDAKKIISYSTQFTSEAIARILLKLYENLI